MLPPHRSLERGFRDAAWRVRYVAISGRQCTIVCDLHLRNLKSRDLAEVFCGIRVGDMVGKTTFPPMVGQR